MKDHKTINPGIMPASLKVSGLLSFLLLIAGCGDNDAARTDTPAASVAAIPAQAELDAQADEQWNMLNTYCMDCHNLDDYSGGLAFDLMNHETITKDAGFWEKVVR